MKKEKEKIETIETMTVNGANVLDSNNFFTKLLKLLIIIALKKESFILYSICYNVKQLRKRYFK